MGFVPTDEHLRPPVSYTRQQDESPLEAAKGAMSIADAWHRLGLQGEPSKSCRSPFREDRSPSFSVYEDGTKWKDHSTGEGGDVCDFVKLALNCSAGEAARWIIEQAGTVSTAPARAKAKPKPREPMQLPTLEKGTPEELDTLAKLRGLPHSRGLQILQDRGLLHFATMPDEWGKVRAWLLTDESRRNAQARRLDGKHWQALDSKPKAKTLKGAEAAWPIGAASMEAANKVYLVEGMPDALAAATLANQWDDWAVVSMIGAALDIHPDALELLQGKSVCIFVHADEAGEKAARKWAKQLTAAGAKVSGLISDHPGRDLNDALTAGEITKIET